MFDKRYQVQRTFFTVKNFPNSVDAAMPNTKVTNSASRWRKIAKNLPQDLIHYTTRKAFAVEFEVLRSSVVQAACSSSLLRFHFQRRSLSCRSKLIQVARWPSGLPPRFGCPLWLRRSPWRSERVEAVGFQSFLYEQRFRICFKSHQNTRAAQKIKLNGKCIRHSDVFVWNGVWFFAQLFSYSCAAMSLLYGNQLEITWLWSYIWLTYTMKPYDN